MLTKETEKPRRYIYHVIEFESDASRKLVKKLIAIEEYSHQLLVMHRKIVAAQVCDAVLNGLAGNESCHFSLYSG